VKVENPRKQSETKQSKRTIARNGPLVVLL